MSYASSNFYCNIEALDEFCSGVNSIVDKTQKYFDYVKEKMAVIQAEKAWEGEGAEEFRNMFNSVEKTYLIYVNEMIQLATCMATTIQLMNEITNKKHQIFG